MMWIGEKCLIAQTFTFFDYVNYIIILHKIALRIKWDKVFKKVFGILPRTQYTLNKIIMSIMQIPST